MEREEKNLRNNVSIINNLATSSGNVKVTLFRKNKKIKTFENHNTGTIHLCRYIRDCLIGENVIAKRPNIIIPCGVDGEELFSAGIISYETKKPLTEDDKSSETFYTLIFEIPGTWMSSNSVIAGFNLYPNDYPTNSKLYAHVDIDDSENYIVVDQDTILQVEWNLYVSYAVNAKEI